MIFFKVVMKKLLSLFAFRAGGSGPDIKLRLRGSSLLVEHVQRDDAVLSDASTKLVSYDVAGRLFTIVFYPIVPTVRAAPQLRLYNNKDKCMEWEMPHLGVGATYKQIVAENAYKFLVKKMRSTSDESLLAKRATVFGLWAAILLLGLFVVAQIGNTQIQAEKIAALSTLTTPRTSTGPAASLAVAARPAVAPIQLSEGDQLNELEKAALSRVVLNSGIELSAGGKAFVVFSDPNCPACRELETRLATLDKSLSPIVVPVSFRPDSPAAVAGILCSKDVLAAWRSAVSGGSSAPGCAKGEAQAVSNNAVFTALKLDKTPTFVTANGKVATGVKDFDGLVRWIKENSGV